MRTSRAFGLRRSLLALSGVAVCLGALPQVAQAITYVYVCLCCRPDGSRVYKSGWINGSCADLTAPIFEECDDLFTALTLPGFGGVGNGYAPAFDRAVTLGSPILSSDGVTATRIVQGTYPAPDTYTPGSYSTRLFAIQEAGILGAPNRFAPIDTSLTGLNPAADSIAISAVPGGVPITGLFDMIPGPLVAGADATIVVETDRAALDCCPDASAALGSISSQSTGRWRCPCRPRASAIAIGAAPWRSAKSPASWRSSAWHIRLGC